MLTTNMNNLLSVGATDEDLQLYEKYIYKKVSAPDKHLIIFRDNSMLFTCPEGTFVTDCDHIECAANFLAAYVFPHAPELIDALFNEVQHA